MPSISDHNARIIRILSTLRASRFNAGLRCPRCTATRVWKWGHFAHRQRFRCAHCKRTFSDLTGTPAAYIKKLALWEDYAGCIEVGTSVRRAAARIGINPTTAFRWRHRLLNDLRSRPRESLADWIELDSTRFVYSEKGSREWRDVPRRRGIEGWRRLWHRQVRVLVACDRRGNLVHSGIAGRRPTVADMERAIGLDFTRPPVICAEHGRFGPGSGFARRNNGIFHDARGCHAAEACGSRSLIHVKNARDAKTRLHGWISRFRGVATKYLPNYLAWHCYVDRGIRHRLSAEILRWPLHGQSNNSSDEGADSVADQDMPTLGR